MIKDVPFHNDNGLYVFEKHFFFCQKGVPLAYTDLANQIIWAIETIRITLKELFKTLKKHTRTF